MKLLVLCLGASVGAAHAQLLPVLNMRNPDWVQTDAKLGIRPSRPDTLPGGRDRMPKANPSRNETDRMPNAMTNKSLLSANGYYRYWDSARQLAYEWKARPGGSAAPDSLVTVYQQATGATYTYRRRLAPTARPRLLGPGN